MFENKLINGVHATRWVRSWTREGGRIGYPFRRSRFYKWLESHDISEEDRQLLFKIATNGKFELQHSAHEFLEKTKDDESFSKEA